MLSAGPVTIHLRSTVTEDRAQLGELADAFRGAEKAQAMLMLVNPTLPAAITLAVSDDLIAAGKDANAAMKLLTGALGGRGGGRPTFASGSLGVDNVEAVVVDRIVPLVAEWIGA